MGTLDALLANARDDELPTALSNLRPTWCAVVIRGCGAREGTYGLLGTSVNALSPTCRKRSAAHEVSDDGKVDSPFFIKSSRWSFGVATK